MFVFAGAATELMGALNPLVAGVVLKLAASKTAEIDSRAIERATCSAQAWVELFCCFFIELFGLNQFSCRFPFDHASPRFPAGSLEKSSENGKDPRSGGGTLVRKNSIFAVVCLSGKSPDFSGREIPDKHQGFCATQSIPGKQQRIHPANALRTTRSTSTRRSVSLSWKGTVFWVG